MRSAGLLLLLAGCDRLFGLFPLVEYGALDARTTDAPPPGACPASYDLTLPSSTSRYRIERSRPDTWRNAADGCRSENDIEGSFTHLIVLTHDGERQELMAHLGTVPVWIGYSDIISDMRFEWVTNESTGSYPTPHTPPWENDDPDKEGPGCVTLRTDGAIGDTACSTLSSWVCECDGYADHGRR